MQFIIIGIDTETIRREKTRLTLKRVISQIADEIPRLAEKILGFLDWYASDFASNGNDEDDSPEERSTKKFCFFKVHLRQIRTHQLPWYTSGFI